MKADESGPRVRRAPTCPSPQLSPTGPTGARCPRPGERGMVTAELAVASLAVAGLIVLVGWLAVVLGLAMRCQDTAWEVARQEARGDAAAVRKARAAAPPGARVVVERTAGQVRVAVDLEARPWVAWLPPVPLRLRAVSLAEPDSP